MSILNQNEPSADVLLANIIKLCTMIQEGDYDPSILPAIAEALSWDFLGLHALIVERNEIPTEWSK